MVNMAMNNSQIQSMVEKQRKAHKLKNKSISCINFAFKESSGKYKLRRSLTAQEKLDYQITENRRQLFNSYITAFSRRGLKGRLEIKDFRSSYESLPQSKRDKSQPISNSS